MQKRVITYLDATDVARLVAAGLGKAVKAGTPHGLLPGIEVSETVWNAYQEKPPGRDAADYLLERFR